MIYKKNDKVIAAVSDVTFGITKGKEYELTRDSDTIGVNIVNDLGKPYKIYYKYIMPYEVGSGDTKTYVVFHNDKSHVFAVIHGSVDYPGNIAINGVAFKIFSMIPDGHGNCVIQVRDPDDNMDKLAQILKEAKENDYRINNINR